MNAKEQILARRYATAYIKAFDDQLNAKDIDTFRSAQEFFCTHSKVLYFLSLPTITNEHKLNVIGKTIKKLHMPPSCMNLMALLVKQKRASLWCAILGYIITLYQEKHRIMDLLVHSVPELSSEQLLVIKQFIADKTDHDIIIQHQVDPDLIAGIRARSDTVLWEYSIAKKLRAIRLSCIQDRG